MTAGVATAAVAVRVIVQPEVGRNFRRRRHGRDLSPQHVHEAGQRTPAWDSETVPVEDLRREGNEVAGAGDCRARGAAVERRSCRARGATDQRHRPVVDLAQEDVREPVVVRGREIVGARRERNLQPVLGDRRGRRRIRAGRPLPIHAADEARVVRLEIAQEHVRRSAHGAEVPGARRERDKPAVARDHRLCRVAVGRLAHGAERRRAAHVPQQPETRLDHEDVGVEVAVVGMQVVGVRCERDAGPGPRDRRVEGIPVSSHADAFDPADKRGRALRDVAGEDVLGRILVVRAEIGRPRLECDHLAASADRRVAGVAVRGGAVGCLADELCRLLGGVIDEYVGDGVVVEIAEVVGLRLERDEPPVGRDRRVRRVRVRPHAADLTRERGDARPDVAHEDVDDACCRRSR